MTTAAPLTGVMTTLPIEPAGDATAALLHALGGAATRQPDARYVATAGGQQHEVVLTPLGPPAAELALAAACGALAVTGDPDRPLQWPAVPLCHGLVGLVAAYQLLAALLAPRDPGAASQRIDPTRWLTYLMGIARAYHVTGVEPRRAGGRNPALAPISPYPDTLLPCADGWVQAHYAPSAPSSLATLLGEPLAPVQALAAQAVTLDQALTDWLGRRTREQAAAEAQELRHPFVSVATVSELRQQYREGLPPPVSLTPPSWPEGEPEPAHPPGPLPLSGVRVAELSVAVAGPMAGELLRLLGATVTRMVHPVAAAPGWYDRGKQTRVADLATEEGRRQVLATVAESHVFLTNFSARAQQNLGLVDLLQAGAAPGLVSVAITAFPHDDPRHLWGAFDAGMQAAVSLADATRYPGGGPLRVAGHPIDAATALTAACAALAGLWQRRQTGQGFSAEVSMLGAGLLLTAPLLAESDSGPVTQAPRAHAPQDMPDLQTIVDQAQGDDWLPF